jgi:diacylglycerol O-acyltransferase / wax synthase
MRRLSGEDAGFLAMEGPEQAMNTIAVGVLRSPDGGPTSLTLDDVRGHLAGRLDQLPSFRWRIVPVPFGLHQPFCLRDPQFDLDFHLRQRTLATGETLDDAVARLAERRLDRRHPLWQVTLLHGVGGGGDGDGDDGGQALVLRYHHALADGVAARTIFDRVFSDLPTPPIPDEPLPWTPEPIPHKATRVVVALLLHLQALLALPALALRSRRGFAAAQARRTTATVAVPDFAGAAPRCELNDAFTPERTYARVALPLAEAKRIKDAAGVTLNDVCLATVAGALRRYLLGRDGLPTEPLLASVPVSYEAPDAPLRQAGNRFWSFTTSLATHEPDPAARLQAISETTREARAQLDALGPDLMPALLDRVPPFVAEPGARAIIDRLRESDGPVDANVLVSNIRGPAEPYRLLGTVVEELWIDGPPSNGVGANVMLWSYGQRLLFGILAFADAVRDPRSLEHAVREAFAELSAAHP